MESIKPIFVLTITLSLSSLHPMVLRPKTTPTSTLFGMITALFTLKACIKANQIFPFMRSPTLLTSRIRLSTQTTSLNLKILLLILVQSLRRSFGGTLTNIPFSTLGPSTTTTFGSLVREDTTINSGLLEIPRLLPYLLVLWHRS